jgi:hypothetical protein
MKRFISLLFFDLRQLVGLLGRVISPSQGPYLHTEQQKHRINANIYVLSGIRTYEPNVRASEDISCFRPRGHCDWPKPKYSLFTQSVSPYVLLTFFNLSITT